MHSTKPHLDSPHRSKRHRKQVTIICIIFGAIIACGFGTCPPFAVCMLHRMHLPCCFPTAPVSQPIHWLRRISGPDALSDHLHHIDGRHYWHVMTLSEPIFPPCETGDSLSVSRQKNERLVPMDLAGVEPASLILRRICSICARASASARHAMKSTVPTPIPFFEFRSRGVTMADETCGIRRGSTPTILLAPYAKPYPRSGA